MLSEATLLPPVLTPDRVCVCVSVNTTTHTHALACLSFHLHRQQHDALTLTITCALAQKECNYTKSPIHYSDGSTIRLFMYRLHLLHMHGSSHTHFLLEVCEKTTNFLLVCFSLTITHIFNGSVFHARSMRLSC